jgi:hypothetical protein
MGTTQVDRSMSRLHGEYRRVFETLEERLRGAYEAGLTKSYFKVFETFRSAERQDYLFKVGTTKARAGQSAHNFGLAVDFVPFVINETGAKNGGWSWSLHHDWDFLQREAEKLGLCNQTAGLRWDKPHVQVCDWKGVVRRTL